MAPKISASDDESEELNLEAIGSESEEISDVVLDDDDDEDVEEEDVADLAEDSDDYEPEEAPRPLRSNRGRETRKRQLAFYEDDMEESDITETPPPRKVTVKQRKPVKADEFPSDLESDYRQSTQRMTERQRAKLMEDDAPERYEELMFAKMDEQLLSLNRKTAKKKETAEQIALRKAENARRRADYKTKQLEEEKRDTLNKLLKRRATKTREKQGDDVPESKRTLKPRRRQVEHAALLRWVCKPEVSVLGMPKNEGE